MSSSPPELSNATLSQLRPTSPGPWQRLRAAFGQESFGRPTGPWRTLATPVPLGAMMLYLARVALLPPSTWLWAVQRLNEIAWLLWAPFALATLGQAIAMGLSARRWRETEGELHLDYSPRAWHYGLATGVVALPLVLLQGCPPFLDLYLSVQLRLASTFGHVASVHVGYNPDWSNLVVLGVLPLVAWQTKRLLASIPCGRLLAFQREIARLRRAVAWEDVAWEGVVADTFDRWVEDLLPPMPDAPVADRDRRLRQRWGGLRREVVLSFIASPPDLLRANRALALFRQSA
ncbi:MAG TPA: hypothetical protein V6D47_11290 [Oscillatoriaceae cyanobacterium]